MINKTEKRVNDAVSETAPSNEEMELCYLNKIKEQETAVIKQGSENIFDLSLIFVGDFIEISHSDGSAYRGVIDRISKQRLEADVTDPFSGKNVEMTVSSNTDRVITVLARAKYQPPTEKCPDKELSETLRSDSD